MMRARTKAYRYFHENEKGTSETLANTPNSIFPRPSKPIACRSLGLLAMAYSLMQMWTRC